MPLRIVRNDITKMNTDAVVNTANDQPTVGTGCDHAIYHAAGFDMLLSYRKEKIGCVPEGDAFITPGFRLKAKYIIHAVSPLYRGGSAGEEEKLRSCYRKSLRLAKEHHLRSIAFPLISTGGFGYPKEEGMRIAVDEINAFLLENEMEVFLVVFSDRAAALGEKLYPGLEEYIDQNYVESKWDEEYGADAFRSSGVPRAKNTTAFKAESSGPVSPADRRRRQALENREYMLFSEDAMQEASIAPPVSYRPAKKEDYDDFQEKLESSLAERMRHVSDTFSQYLMYLIQTKNLKNADVYKRAIVDKKIFSKIKNNVNYHPQKLTALCLCVGAGLNLDESKDLLARAGYALSPCDKTDIIFAYFIENGIYDMIELDIQLEEHGLPCIIE